MISLGCFKLMMSVLFVCTGLSGVALAIGDRIPASRLAFISERDSNLEIYMAHIERGLLVNATQHPVSDNAPQWSPDGKWIVFRSNRDEDTTFYLLNTQTWHLDPISEVNTVYSPAWSPQSDRIAFRENPLEISWENPYQFRIYTLTTQEIITTQEFEGWELGGPSVVVTDRAVYSNDLNLNRIILPDIDGFPRFSRIPPEDFPPDGFVETFSSLASLPSLSPDWTYFAAPYNLDNNTEIFLVPAWEGEAINLTNHPAPDTEPVWSPDGHYIAFISYRDGNSEVYVVNIKTGETTNVSNHPRRDYTPIWSP